MGSSPKIFESSHKVTFTADHLDLSGGVQITLPQNPNQPVMVPGLALLEFVADWVRRTKLGALESALTHDLLGVRAVDMPLWSAPAKGPRTPEPLTQVKPPELREQPPGDSHRQIALAPTGDVKAPSEGGLADPKPFVAPVHHSDDPPTEKQVEFFCKLLNSHVIPDGEKVAAYDWLATKATKTGMKPMLDGLKQRVARRKAKEAEAAKKA